MSRKHNDWSQVRVWHIPGGYWGGRTYEARGFIHPYQLERRRRLQPLSFAQIEAFRRARHSSAVCPHRSTGSF